MNFLTVTVSLDKATFRSICLPFGCSRKKQESGENETNKRNIIMLKVSIRPKGLLGI